MIGDSISANFPETNWVARVAARYNHGYVTMHNRAIAGAHIMDGVASMDVQVAAAAGDDADLILINLGLNDDEDHGQAAIQAELEENFAELKASNPRAAIYYINVLPAWTDATGATETLRPVTRAAVAAACAAQGVTCWDSYTTPWIAPEDTSDGWHPTDAGSEKIANEVLARL